MTLFLSIIDNYKAHTDRSLILGKIDSQSENSTTHHKLIKRANVRTKSIMSGLRQSTL